MPEAGAALVPLTALMVSGELLPPHDISIRTSRVFLIKYGEDALVTQFMKFSFSAVKLHEETIKNTLNMYLIIFVKHNVIIIGKCR